MRTDIFIDTSCPLCKSNEHLDRIEHIYGREQTGLVVFCRKCAREFLVIAHVFGGAHESDD